MPITAPSGRQILDGSIQRADLDATTVGQAVIRKVVQGAGISLSSTGADAGTGDVTVSNTGLLGVVMSGASASDVVVDEKGDYITPL